MLTIGVNITEHSCVSCGIHDKNVAFITTHEHIDVDIIETNCSSHNTCCQTKNISESHHHNKSHSSNCCDFDNKYLKLLNLFSPENILKIGKTVVFSDSFQFNNILSNINILNFERKIFFTLKIPNSIPILSKLCVLIL